MLAQGHAQRHGSLAVFPSLETLHAFIHRASLTLTIFIMDFHRTLGLPTSVIYTVPIAKSQEYPTSLVVHPAYIV